MSIDLTAELGSADFTVKADEVQHAVATSGELPPGKYHAILDGASLELGDNPKWELWFQVIAGAFSGRKVKYTIWTSTSGKDKDGNPLSKEKLDAAVARIRNEFGHTGEVLGLMVKTGKDASGENIYKKLPGKLDFRDVRGAECVVITALRPSSKPGDDRKFPEVKMFGCKAINDPDAKGAILATSGSSRPAPSPTAGKASDYADLASQV